MAGKCCKCGSWDNYNFAINNGMCNICIGKELERIQELEAQLEQHRWIPVSERLPKSPTQYLCCYSPYGGELPSMYFATTWSKAKGFYLETGAQVFPTHWKPIILP